MFIKESHATALFAGGFGTLDEGFESLTLVQTGKSDPRPIVFVENPRGNFWRPMLKFFNEKLAKGGMISEHDRSIYQIAYSAEEAVDYILSFYSVYHSLRYVKDRLVLRLAKPLTDANVLLLSRDFKDLISWGGMQQTAALPEESDEPLLEQLPRLVFRYNRKEYGRLIELIHAINRMGSAPYKQPAKRAR